MRTIGAIALFGLMPSLALADETAEPSSLDALLAAASSSFDEAEPIAEVPPAEAEEAMSEDSAKQGIFAKLKERRALRRAARAAPAS